MKTIKLGLLHHCKLYDSIKELPMVRYQEFNKLLLQDVGIGSDMQSVSNHFSSFYNLIVNKKTDELLQETKNLNNNIYYMIEKLNIKSFCFAAMTHSIDGQEVSTLNENDAKSVINKLSSLGLKQSDCEEIVNDIKKNLTQNFDPIFQIDMEIQH